MQLSRADSLAAKAQASNALRAIEDLGTPNAASAELSRLRASIEAIVENVTSLRRLQAELNESSCDDVLVATGLSLFPNREFQAWRGEHAPFHMCTWDLMGGSYAECASKQALALYVTLLADPAHMLSAVVRADAY